jgi:hypothetical protein
MVSFGCNRLKNLKDHDIATVSMTHHQDNQSNFTVAELLFAVKSQYSVYLEFDCAVWAARICNVE